MTSAATTAVRCYRHGGWFRRIQTLLAASFVVQAVGHWNDGGARWFFLSVAILSVSVVAVLWTADMVRLTSGGVDRRRVLSWVLLPWGQIDDVPQPTAWRPFVTVTTGGKEVPLATVPKTEWAFVRARWLEARAEIGPADVVGSD